MSVGLSINRGIRRSLPHELEEIAPKANGPPMSCRPAVLHPSLARRPPTCQPRDPTADGYEPPALLDADPWEPHAEKEIDLKFLISMADVEDERDR